MLLCSYLFVIASLGVQMAFENFNPELAIYFTAMTMGFILGVLATVAVTLAIRSGKLRLTRYSVRDLLIGLTLGGVMLGIMSYILNKK